MGIFSIIIGVGLAFVKINEDTQSKDISRFGEMANLSWIHYHLLKIGTIRLALAITCIILGLIFICYGLGYIKLY
jgi:hypothetical protein